MKLFKKLFLAFIVAIMVISALVILCGYQLYRNSIEERPLSKVIAELESKDKYVFKEDLPKHYIDAVVAVEDHRFYDHGAIDITAILRAIVRNITNRKLLEGGSTITQQVANNLYFIEEDNSPILRKIAEIFVATDLEKEYEKDKILEIYVNTIYFGDGYYGIKEASNGYLKKEPKDMTLYEATMLAGIPNAPSVYAPTVNPDLTRSRQKKVISDMVKYEYLSQEEADKIEQSK